MDSLISGERTENCSSANARASVQSNMELYGLKVEKLGERSESLPSRTSIRVLLLRVAFLESEMQMGGKCHPKLNIQRKSIENKDHEGKLKRTPRGALKDTNTLNLKCEKLSVL
jgi:hypothetical protein